MSGVYENVDKGDVMYEHFAEVLIYVSDRINSIYTGTGGGQQTTTRSRRHVCYTYTDLLNG